jgi:hypothetical protein
VASRGHRPRDLARVITVAGDTVSTRAARRVQHRIELAAPRALTSAIVAAQATPDKLMPSICHEIRKPRFVATAALGLELLNLLLAHVRAAAQAFRAEAAH